MTTPALCSTIASIAFFACMGWAVRGHFLGRAAPGMHLATAANAAIMAWLLAGRWQVMRHPGLVSDWAEVASTVVTLAALALFWWAIATTRKTRLTLAFSEDNPVFLVDGGPYAHVRHPFYSSYVLSWVGGAIASPWIAFWIAPAAMAILYLRAARLEESKFARSGLSDIYRAYQARTGALLPRLPSRDSQVAS